MSYAASALPPALLELTLLRVSGASPRLTGGGLRWKSAFARRAMHQVATPSSSQITDNGLGENRLTNGRNRSHSRGGITAKTNTKIQDHETSFPLHIQELENRVTALEQTVQSEEIDAKSFFYTEEDLLAMYEDVLAVPIPEDVESDNKAAQAAVEKAVAEAERQEDLMLLRQLEARLCINEEGEPETTHPNQPAYRRILYRAQEIVARADAVRRNATPDSANRVFQIPIGVLSPREYEALVRASMIAKDTRAGEVALEIAKMAGLPMPEKVVTTILEMYATAGKSEAADKLLANFLTDTPTTTQRDLHIRAHLNATPMTVLPISALDLLHRYEEQNAVAPMHTYTTLISSLYSRPLALARAHAWDIFSHMRYVAHPDPDVDLYTLMIKACASPVSVSFSSETEKALDLWTEMTSDHQLTPTVASYNAVILACAKSGEKMYVNEAFRLARQMLDSNRDARGFSAFRPDLETFCALLEGCKRIGDLARARWILVEMVKGGQKDDVHAVKVKINDEAMMHIFHAYAAYKPPVIRPKLVSSTPEDKSANVASQAQQSPDDATQTEVKVAESSQQTWSNDLGLAKEQNGDPANTFSRLPPQSHAQVVREAKLLMNAIVHDHSSKKTPSSSPKVSKFRNVEISPRLLSSYLSVFYNHAPLEESRELFRTIFKEFGVKPTPRLYVEALEKCGNARRGPERQVAVEFSDELWEQWSKMEDFARINGRPLEARLVERAHVAKIRALSKADRISRAMDQLKAFGAKYPPHVIKNPPPKLPLRSTRTSLVGLRPLVRMTPITEVPDDAVPPLVTFRDLAVLHHRLIEDQRVKDIGYITWLCRSYEWALRIRRAKATKAKVQTNPNSSNPVEDTTNTMEESEAFV